MANVVVSNPMAVGAWFYEDSLSGAVHWRTKIALSLDAQGLDEDPMMSGSLLLHW